MQQNIIAKISSSDQDKLANIFTSHLLQHQFPQFMDQIVKTRCEQVIDYIEKNIYFLAVKTSCVNLKVNVLKSRDLNVYRVLRT